jgi:acylphosphatase
MREAAPMPPERRQVHYSGRVQGVGFRYTARIIAQRFAVAGYVRNLADGRVQLVIEGPPAELDRFLAAVAEQLSDHIDGVAIESGPATIEFTGFEIRP